MSCSWTPVTWFDMLYNLSGNLPNTLKTARSYLNSVLRKYKLPPSIELTMNSIPSKIYCGHHADCKYPPPLESNNKNVWKAPSFRGESSKCICDMSSEWIGINNCPEILLERPSKNHNSNHEEPPVFCAGIASQQVCFPRYCNWYVEKERIVIGEDGRRLDLCAQQDEVREILICSHQETYNIYDKNTRPNNHKTNKHLVIDKKLWIWWESLESKDYQAKECHGQPKQYGIQNCIELETHCLLSSEMGQVIEEINGLRSETNGINAMKDDLNQKLYATLKLIQKRLSSSSC
ncbi:hypothetical protein RhiirA1_464127 [Rhizophagus irregularis]|uniref:Uncharacterized protein n=1 Tax=Rhizophagus irregularis TaxID=588596 RepID=A0A2I1E112_9GLOM|nr:hypothetical protein RhiirA1_464127 [Rhizophagus irregularis]PKY15808.1 hypothetical protein RhiirB3_428064 [Rhizophagus irregularis]